MDLSIIALEAVTSVESKATRRRNVRADLTEEVAKKTGLEGK